MAKEEIARFEQFLLLFQCFQKSSAAEASESVYLWERVKVFGLPQPASESLSRATGGECFNDLIKLNCMCKSLYFYGAPKVTFNILFVLFVLYFFF